MRDDRIKLDENAVCSVCGRFGAFNFGGEFLCMDCYEAHESCCLEFGGEDLWQFDEPPKSREPVTEASKA